MSYCQICHIQSPTCYKVFPEISKQFQPFEYVSFLCIGFDKSSKICKTCYRISESIKKSSEKLSILKKI